MVGPDGLDAMWTMAKRVSVYVSVFVGGYARACHCHVLSTPFFGVETEDLTNELQHWQHPHTRTHAHTQTWKRGVEPHHCRRVGGVCGCVCECVEPHPNPNPNLNPDLSSNPDSNPPPRGKLRLLVQNTTTQNRTM